MKKCRFLSVLLTACVLVSCFAFPPKAEAAVTPSQVQANIDSYYSIVSSGGVPHWNANQTTATLMQYANQGAFRNSITYRECPGKWKAEGCISNDFGNARQCFGFAKYMCYVLFGSYPKAATGKGLTAVRNSDANWTYYKSDVSTCPTLLPGDMIRYWNGNGMAHAAVVYSVGSNGAINVIDCNHSSRANGKCAIDKCSPINLTMFTSYYNKGCAYVCRNKAMVSTCSGSHVPGQYLWYEADHPHYSCYSCAICGTTFRDSATNTMPSCVSCTTPAVQGSITLNKARLTLTANACEKLTATTTPAGQAVTWSSSAPFVATVDSNGVVTAVGAGFAAITAQMTYNGTVYEEHCITQVQEPEIVNSVEFSGIGSSNITQTSAKVSGTCEYEGSRPSTVGLNLGTSESNLAFYAFDTIGHDKNPFSVWYNLKNLTPDTTYYYQFYAMVDEEVHAGPVRTFRTDAPAPIPEPTPEPEPAPVEPPPPDTSISLPVKGVSSITQNSARVDASCVYEGAHPDVVGIYLGTSISNLTYYNHDDINHNKNPFNIWYNLKDLAPGTTYYYQFYANRNDATFYSEIGSFTTEAAPTYTPPPVSTRTGVVVNTNGQYLAINDRPASSSSGSSIQIGRIPPGGVITVYPDQTSGNWYYVSYNGVSGYAYNRYIALQ